MNVMGIFLKSNNLRIVTLSGTKKNHVQMEQSFHKIEIPKDNNHLDISMAVNTLRAFWTQNQIEAIGVNGRLVGAGGALTFKSEGILLAIANTKIKPIWQATIKATNRKRIDDKTARPSTKDLGAAYDIAFELLPE